MYSCHTKKDAGHLKKHATGNSTEFYMWRSELFVSIHSDSLKIWACFLIKKLEKYLFKKCSRELLTEWSIWGGQSMTSIKLQSTLLRLRSDQHSRTLLPVSGRLLVSIHQPQRVNPLPPAVFPCMTFSLKNDYWLSGEQLKWSRLAD